MSQYPPILKRKMAMDKADKLNIMIDEAINALADDNIEHGAEALVELAQMFANAGASLQSFANVRQHVVQEAEKKTSVHFIREKLKCAERILQNDRPSKESSRLSH